MSNLIRVSGEGMKDSWFMRPFRIRGGCWRPANVVVPERLCMRDQRLTALASRDESHGPAMLVTPEAQVIHMVIGASSHR